MRQARNQATLLIGVSSTNRRPNGGHQPDAIHSSPRVDQEEHQGVGGVFANRRVRIQSRTTLNNRQVPLRGRLRFQPIVPIGHTTATTTRANEHGRKRKSKLPQEGA